MFDIAYDTVEDVLRRCAGLLGLDLDQVLESAALLHETSVITGHLSKDFKAVTTKLGPPPTPPPLPAKYLLLADSQRMLLRRSACFGGFRCSLSFSSGVTRKREKLTHGVCCEAAEIYELTLVMS